MRRQLFFLKKEGWVEAEIAGNLVNSSRDELLKWAYEMMKECGYRNYLIREATLASLDPYCIRFAQLRDCFGPPASGLAMTVSNSASD